MCRIWPCCFKRATNIPLKESWNLYQIVKDILTTGRHQKPEPKPEPGSVNQRSLYKLLCVISYITTNTFKSMWWFALKQLTKNRLNPEIIFSNLVVIVCPSYRLANADNLQYPNYENCQIWWEWRSLMLRLQQLIPFYLLPLNWIITFYKFISEIDSCGAIQE
jgi:hypothetical protein